MFDLAMNCNSDDLDDTKHMAAGYMTLNMDNIKDAFQLFTEFEKQDIANKDDVSKLHDILSNKQLIEKVKIYEGITYFSHYVFRFWSYCIQKLKISENWKLKIENLYGVNCLDPTNKMNYQHGPIFQNLVFFWRIITPKMQIWNFGWNSQAIWMYKAYLYIAVACNYLTVKA